jgi:hypothetical protein
VDLGATLRRSLLRHGPPPDARSREPFSEAALGFLIGDRHAGVELWQPAFELCQEGEPLECLLSALNYEQFPGLKWIWWRTVYS